MSVWNSAFEASPAGGDSPASGDDKIRELKGAVRERLAKEHKMDLSSGAASADGWHIQGSAISFYSASSPTVRTDGATALDASDYGRLWYNTSTGALSVYTATGWVQFSSASAASLLALLKTVDGTGSGLDADMVRGASINSISNNLGTFTSDTDVSICAAPEVGSINYIRTYGFHNHAATAIRFLTPATGTYRMMSCKYAVWTSAGTLATPVYIDAARVNADYDFSAGQVLVSLSASGGPYHFVLETMLIRVS
jgi:hypothetical protein